MSGNPGEMVYTNPRDFAKYYPWLLPYGYNNCYECMGILHDPHVPETLKRTYMVAHAYNQRYRFAPNPSYSALLKGLVDMGKDRDCQAFEFDCLVSFVVNCVGVKA
eukprot:272037-Amphidinium_carterae.1